MRGEVVSLNALFKAKQAGTVTAGDALAQQGAVTDGDTLETFLSTVLPPHGEFCAFTLPDRRHHWANSHAELAETIRRLGDNPRIYYAPASFLNKAKGRTQENVAHLKCFRLDIDAGEKKLAKHPGTDKVYATQSEARAALREFCEREGLTPTLEVSSGEGLHVYFVLNEAVSPRQWRPVAEKFQKFCAARGLKADANVTADHARVLRPIGTLHPNGKRVEILESTGKVYSLSEFASLVGATEPDALTPSRSHDLSVNADVAPQHNDIPADHPLINAECEALRFASDPANQAHVEEPYWRAVLGIVKHCVGADDLAHEVSRHHPDYDPEATERKLAGWTSGPPLCETFEGFNPEACAGCKHRGKIKTPLVLGRVGDEAQRGDGGSASLTKALESGALQALVDQNGVLNYVESYVRDGRKCRSVYESGTVEANDLILSAATAANGRAPSQQAIASVEARLRSAARRTGAFTPMHLRVARTDAATFHDLGPGRIVRIDASGWQVVEESDDVPLFRRGDGAGELPTPELFAGDAAQALAFCCNHYRELFGTPTDRAILAAAVLLDRLDPHTPHPVMERVGASGSGKTTVTVHDTNMIDPSSDDNLRITAHGADDIAAAAQQQYVLTMDNVSRLDQTTSDVLCIASTGGSLTARQFREQKKAVVLTIHRPVNIAAVNPVCNAPDLQTRTVREEFSPPKSGADVVSEPDMRALIRQKRPAFLGALYTLKVAALRALPEVQRRKGWSHRMVAFDQTGEAMLTAAGCKAGAFLKIVGNMRDSLARRSASGDVFILRLRDALRTASGWPHEATEPHPREVLQRPRQGAVFSTSRGICAVMRPGVLLSLLPKPDPWDKDRAIPKTERALMDALRRVQPTLRGLGVSYRENNYSGRALACFEWLPDALED